MNLFRYILGGAAAAVILTGCDEVGLNDRYIQGEDIVAERTVLLEDFTGQECLNCPNAHEEIEKLEEQYGDKLIAVSIHCGPFGISTRRTNFERGRIGLMSEEGNALMEAYGIQSFPMGVVNMGSPSTYGLWAGEVRNALQLPTDVKISNFEIGFQEGETNADGTPSGTISAHATVLSETTRQVNVQMWLLEDNIVAQQKYPDGSVTQDYVHNNVFRAQFFDGLKGESVNIISGFESQIDGSIPLRWDNREHWNKDNLSVVCIVSDRTGVLQAAKISFINSDQTQE